jgi:hypothetical protein
MPPSVYNSKHSSKHALTKTELLLCLLSPHSLQQYDRLLYRESGMFSPTDSSISHKSNAKSYISVKDIVFTRTMPEKCYDGSEASDADPVCSKDHGYIDIVCLKCTVFCSLYIVHSVSQCSFTAQTQPTSCIYNMYKVDSVSQCNLTAHTAEHHCAHILQPHRCSAVHN